MAEITAALVKELREKSGVGMMDCKKALAETDGDMEAALDWLRAKGLSKAAKKADRVAAEGLIAIASRRDGKAQTAAVVELNAETDFVARNELFQNAARQVAQTALDVTGEVEALAAATMADGVTVAEAVTQLIATIGENMNLRRSAVIEVKHGVIGSYVHNTVKPGLGKLGVIVGLESTGDKAVLAALGKQVAMHIANTNPLSVSPDDIDPAVVAKEREIFTEQAKESGKPAEVIAKMVEGRVRKFFEESTLLAQVFVIDGESKVGDVVKKAEKDAGAPIKVTKFVRYALGEGIEKVETDFAAEVAATSGVPQNA